MAVSDYMYLVLPAAGVGVTTILLELQFAWPWLNDKFWKKAWRFGGPLMGRVTNIAVNFLYGMALYGAGVGSAALPTLWGANPVPFQTMDFVTAATTAFVGGLIFHVAMGQFQTDISREEQRGSISGMRRYGLETTGVVVNNSARVFDWVIPGQWGVWAQGAFFMLKTFPQLLKSNWAHKVQDERIRHQLLAEKAGPKRFWHKCSDLLASLELVNLPTLKK
jgi:hypothetical protein